jgi:hypothetical protein
MAMNGGLVLECSAAPERSVPYRAVDTAAVTIALNLNYSPDLPSIVSYSFDPLSSPAIVPTMLPLRI